MSKLRLLFLFLLPLYSLVVGAQDQEFLQAKVLDQNTGEPIIFATVRTMGKAKGVITNMDGSFRLPLTYREDGESIEVSSMGYEKKVFELQKLSPNDINILYLTPGVLSLTEAVVSAKKKRELSAKRIVRRAIENIPNNYPSSNFAAVGYYRDYQIKDDNYVNLNEAILEVVDSGFDTNDEKTSKVRIYDYRPNTDFEQDLESRSTYDYENRKKVMENAYMKAYGGNEFTILRAHDALRNYTINSYDFVNVLERDFIKTHTFRKENTVNQDSEQLFVISFRHSLETNRVEGELYISKTDYAIYKMSYKVYDLTKKVLNRQVRKGKDEFEVVFEVNTEYKRNQDKMYPNYISHFNAFKIMKDSKFIMEDFYANAARAYFEVKFNDFVDKATGSNKKNYNLSFRGKKISFSEIKVRGATVELFPKNDNNFSDLLNKVNSFDVGRKDVELSFELKNIRNSALTSTVNEKTYEDYTQYREFFVQEIKPNGSVLKDTLFMKKDRPIFQDQPMLKPDNFDEYWMNTPLQKVD